jgi:hypothetical protein
MVNTLYCGMADDILTPLLYVPDLDHLFAICLFDPAFAPADNQTWVGQKNDIKKALLEGTNDNCHHSAVYRKYIKDYRPTNLAGKSTIILEDESNGCWSLRFVYNGKPRTLTYYHDRDFRHPWPEDIQNISHLLSIGAPFPTNHPVIEAMLKERTLDDCLYYSQWESTDQNKNVRCPIHEWVNINPMKLLIGQGEFDEDGRTVITKQTEDIIRAATGRN